LQITTGWHESSIELLEISKQCKGLSGRTLSKLPFLAFSELQEEIVHWKKYFKMLLSKAVKNGGTEVS
jgi:hypothetical protein